MAWDDNAKKLAIKTIGTVESNLKYDCIYYADPITVGIMQWYATRAAKLLNKIRATAGAWVGVENSLTNALSSHSEDDGGYWTSRYLTKAEGSSLKGVLTSAVGVQIQNAQTLEDLEAYRVRAAKADLDANTNTNAFIFWCVMYHQSPRYALQILNSAGENPTLARLHSMTLNHSWYRGFKTRYNRAKTIIESGDTSGVPDMGVTPTPGDDGDDGDDNDGTDGTQTVTTDISHVMVVGENIHVIMKGGATFVCVPNGPVSWTPSNRASGGTPVVPEPEINNPTPELPGGGGTPTHPTTDADAKRAAVVKWMTSRNKKFAYSQGPGRLDPDRSGLGDCSSTVRRAYKDVMGIEIGLNTVLQQTRKGGPGKEVWRSPRAYAPVPDGILKPGDLIFFKSPWSDSRVRHVEMYTGNGKCWGHGGGAGGKKPGPQESSLSYWVGAKAQLIVMRYIF